MAKKRLLKELNHLSSYPSSVFSVSPIVNESFLWTVDIIGPSDSPYSGGIFSLQISFPNDYPHKPPKFNFTTRIWHPNINSSGNIALDILYDPHWSSGFTMSSVLHRIHNLLEVPDLDDMPVEPEIADQYKKDRSAYEAKAKEWTKLYATVKGESVASIAGTGA